MSQARKLRNKLLDCGLQVEFENVYPPSKEEWCLLRARFKDIVIVFVFDCDEDFVRLYVEHMIPCPNGPCGLCLGSNLLLEVINPCEL